jgi:enoyl-CoA hydratase/carnithine racemase
MSADRVAVPDTDLIVVSGPEDGVATITLNRPDKRNALSAALRERFCDALERLSVDPGLRLLVITGAGPVFSAGFDLDEMKAGARKSPAERAEAMILSDRFHLGVLRFPLPVIASVNGPALGGGFDLTVLADLRVASDTARFAHPEQAWGDVIYRPLRDLVGGSIARDLALTGRSIDANEAHRLGLVNQVVPPLELGAATGALAASIAGAPRDVLLRMKAKIIAASGIPETAATLDL